MPRDFPESDWKIFRELRLIALDRYCRRVLSEVATLAADPDKTNHERYLAIYELTRERDRDLASAFNAPRRSMAMIQLMLLCSLGLLTEDEIARFSPETFERLGEINPYRPA